MSTTDRAKELSKIIADARDELYEIQAQERKTDNQKFVGKFFRYSNGYSLTDRWWFYFAVTGMNQRGELQSWNFQKDCNGKIEIETDYTPDGIISSSKQITKAEFYRVYSKIVKEIQDKVQS